MKKLGFIVNPIAGMGGAVGLKGTDGLVERAVFLGAVPGSGKKAARAIQSFKQSSGLILKTVTLMTLPGSMGGDVAFEYRIPFEPVAVSGLETTAQDTILSARAMLENGVDLILFAGGDGTARDICTAVKDQVPVIGIPGGVKIHSPVFAQTPEKAGELAAKFLTKAVTRVKEQEVLDIDEDAYRKGRVITRLYGYLKVPDDKRRIQNRKAPSVPSEAACQRQIAWHVIDNMMKDQIYLVGPGTTCRPILENLSLDHSILGVDVICNQKMLKKDATEKQILELIKDRQVNIVITPIGGQGFLFGRGNHQISPGVIKKAGKKNITIVATPEKMAAMEGRPLLIDSGDPAIDQEISGYVRVLTGYRQEMMYRLE